MKDKEDLEKAFDKLIGEGEAFRRDFQGGYRYKWYRCSPLNGGFSKWKAETLALLERALGRGSDCYRDLCAAEERLAPAAPLSVFRLFLDSLKKAGRELGGRPEPPPAD